MQTTEQSKLLDSLHSSAAYLKNAVTGVPEDAAKARPKPDCWSILEILEHVVVVESRICGRIGVSPRVPDEIVNQEREELLMSRIPTRADRFKAPEAVWPNGRFATVADALTAFSDGRRKPEQIISELGPELRRIEMQHPFLGALSAYEMLLVLAGHAVRHGNQILEVKESLKDPTRQIE